METPSLGTSLPLLFCLILLLIPHRPSHSEASDLDSFTLPESYLMCVQLQEERTPVPNGSRLKGRSADSPLRELDPEATQWNAQPDPTETESYFNSNGLTPK